MRSAPAAVLALGLLAAGGALACPVCGPGAAPAAVRGDPAHARTRASLAPTAWSSAERAPTAEPPALLPATASGPGDADALARLDPLAAELRDALARGEPVAPDRLGALSLLGNGHPGVVRERVVTLYRELMRAGDPRAGYLAPDLIAWQDWRAVPEALARLRADAPLHAGGGLLLLGYLEASPVTAAREVAAGERARRASR